MVEEGTNEATRSCSNIAQVVARCAMTTMELWSFDPSITSASRARLVTKRARTSSRQAAASANVGAEVVFQFGVVTFE